MQNTLFPALVGTAAVLLSIPFYVLGMERLGAAGVAPLYRFQEVETSRRAVEVPGFPGMTVLAPEDRILHAATLLVHDDTLSHGLRDLSDLDLLLRQAATEDGFWPRLLARTADLDLNLPLFYGLRYATHFFGTPASDEARDSLASAAPCWPAIRLMDGIYTRMLAPNHHSCQDGLAPLARHATYLRAHWQRRPPRLLVPHLFHKAFNGRYQHAPKPA